MTTVSRKSQSGVQVLRRVSYDVYVLLSDAWENRHLKMTYVDGTLQIASPHLAKHQEPSRWLSILVPIVAAHLGLRYHGTRSATFRRGGEGIYKGVGKEPDESFYITNAARLARGRDVNLDAGDPPPDLWIEVDNRGSSKGKLPVYAALGVPEVWRFRTNPKTLQFLRRVGDAYERVERSLALPVLTPELVLEALALGDDRLESDWVPLVREWAATLPTPQG